MIEKTLKHIYIIAALFLIGYAIFIFRRDKQPASIQVPGRIDTVIVKEIHHKPIQANNQPVKVIIQEKRDTIYRDRLEKESIISRVGVKGNEVDIEKVDSAGKVTEEKHQIEEGSKVTITPEGVEEKKRTKAGKMIRKAGKVALRVLEVAGGIFILTKVL